MDLNVLIRGQSNALLFVDRGGAAALEKGLEGRLGVDVHLLAEWGSDSSTIHSGTAFMNWDTDGQQASMLRYINELPADIKDNPTAVVWMHNEYDQNDWTLTADTWLRDVRVDADMLRGALGQGAETTPYTFVPIRYPYGSNWSAVGDGMAALDADASFNASISWDAGSLTMDGDGYANSSHMGNADAVWLGGKLAETMAEGLRPLADGGLSPQQPQQPAPVTPAVPEAPPAPEQLSAGEGPDALVLKVSQDAYQGSAQYQVFVDGVQAGDTFTASAWRSAGEGDTLTLRGDWGPGEHAVEIRFLNDAWGGSAETDRNLYVDGATYNGEAVEGAAQAVLTDTAAGAFSFAEAAAPEPELPADHPAVTLAAGEGLDALVLKVSQDAYDGDALYQVFVDGQQVGGTFDASALHSSGQSDTLTLKGDWAAGEHNVEVRFLNDAWGGSAEADRNLHVDGATYNGEAVEGAAQVVWSDWQPGGFSFTEAEAPRPPPVVVVRGTDGPDLFEVGPEGGASAGGGGCDLYLPEAGDGHATATGFASRADKLVFTGLLVTDGGTAFLQGVAALAGKDLAFG